VENMVGS